MTADELIAEARANRPPEPAPELWKVEHTLRRLLASMLHSFNYDAEPESGEAKLCRVVAAVTAEVQALQRRPLAAVRASPLDA